MADPFEDASASYVVLINDEAQYSLWPAWMKVPQGWRVAAPSADRETCLKYVESCWTDMRPRSLIREVEGDG